MLLTQNESSLTHFFTMNLNATPMLMHSFSTQQFNSYYLQEDSMSCYLAELKMFFFLSLSYFSHFSYGFQFVFVYSVLLSLICTYIPVVCNFLHVVSLAVLYLKLKFMAVLCLKLCA